jgi:hypothetical protein
MYYTEEIQSLNLLATVDTDTLLISDPMTSQKKYKL